MYLLYKILLKCRFWELMGRSMVDFQTFPSCHVGGDGDDDAENKCHDTLS